MLSIHMGVGPCPVFYPHWCCGVTETSFLMQLTFLFVLSLKWNFTFALWFCWFYCVIHYRLSLKEGIESNGEI